MEAGALSILEAYPWPGNVRELRNVLERVMIMVPDDTITPRDVMFLDSHGGPVRDIYEGQALKLHDAHDRFERDYILHALAAQQGNISRTAEILGVERSNLYRKMRACGIGPVRKMEGEDRSA